MITKRHLIIAILATFCLTATVFMIRPTRSQSGVGEYNPWADYNGDGVIDIFDVVPAAVAFSSAGDPTRNVTLTNPQLEIHFNINSIGVNLAFEKLIGNGETQTYERSTFAYNRYHWILKVTSGSVRITDAWSVGGVEVLIGSRTIVAGNTCDTHGSIDGETLRLYAEGVESGQYSLGLYMAE